MLEIIRNRILKNQRGAIDKVIVTLILVIFSVGAMVGLNNWAQEQEKILKERTSKSVAEAREDANSG